MAARRGAQSRLAVRSLRCPHGAPVAAPARRGFPRWFRLLWPQRLPLLTAVCVQPLLSRPCHPPRTPYHSRDGDGASPAHGNGSLQLSTQVKRPESVLSTNQAQHGISRERWVCPGGSRSSACVSEPAAASRSRTQGLHTPVYRIMREQKSCNGIAVPCTENSRGGEARPSGAVRLRPDWEHQVHSHCDLQMANQGCSLLKPKALSEC
ncbi:uncharacterized protein LOC132332925 isoform X3 [Haemorhous mexicanus]|uniref:uncharacterized protein LOC132332925 isoform X3 n=1 Tax=Haemorhous mexicanus TaxID=30427 RepID=UPI0028BD8646|nr:uncharacterized protein LOC132332925 isoform X3 [Haemorhous mexicanus]